MGIIKKIKSMYFTTMSTLWTVAFVKVYKDRLIVVIDGEVIYKGEKYDELEGTGKARSIKAKGDKDGEMRTMIEGILKREGAI